MNNEQTFFKLLKYSNALKKNKKYLQKEDPQAFDDLLNFLIIIETNLHYLEKKASSHLANDFLKNEISAENFSYYFMGIYEGISKKLNQMTIDESFWQIF